MKTFTKDELISRLNEIKNMGWVKNAREGNCGGIGNTLEDLLGIEENNLPIPNAIDSNSIRSGVIQIERPSDDTAGWND